MISKLIKNCRILEEGKLVERTLFLEDHKIKTISDEIITAEVVIDAKGMVVLPGMIDCHVHCREPGMTDKEDFLTASKAAAAGGVTTIIDMPNTKPATTTVGLLEQKRELAKKSIVNYGFHFGSTMENLSQITHAKNIASVKIYMDETTGELMMNDETWIKKIIENSKRVSVHAEGDNVEKAVNFVKGTKNKLYLCHISRASEVEYLKKHKLRNKVFVEVTPHHLFLTEEDKSRLGNFALMKPGIGNKQDQDALWEFLKNGKVDTIGSDHAPHTSEDKKEAVFGVPGLETTMPLLLNAVNDEKLTLQKVVELTAENPAKIFGIKDKGKIEEGYDADLIFIDMGLEKEVRNEELFTKCKWSPFNGMKLKGWPVMTMVNGNLIYQDNKINEITKGNEVIFQNEKRFGKTIVKVEGSEPEAE